MAVCDNSGSIKMFVDVDHRYTHAGLIQEEEACCYFSGEVKYICRWTGRFWGWGGGDRLRGWGIGRLSSTRGALMSAAARGQQTAEARVRKEGSSSAGRGAEVTGQCTIILYPSRGPFVLQSNRTCPDWTWLQAQEVHGHADTCGGRFRSLLK